MLEKVTPGDPFRPKAVEWNAIIEATRGYRNNGSPERNPFPPALSAAAHAVRVYNATDRDVPERGIVRLVDPVFTPTENDRQFLDSLTFRAGTPAAAEWFAVTTRPLPPDSTDPDCIYAGLVAVRLLCTDPDHRRARPIGGNVDHLESAAFGPAMIRYWEEPAVDQVSWAIVELPGAHRVTPLYAGTLDAELHHGDVDALVIDLVQIAGDDLALDLDATATALNDLGHSGPAGSKVLILWNELALTWQILWVKTPRITFCSGRLAARTEGTATTPSVVQVAPINPDVAPDTELLVANPYKLAGEATDLCLILYFHDDVTPPRLLDVERREVKPIIALAIDDTDPENPQVIATRRTLWVHATTPEETVVVDEMTICGS